MADFCSSAVQTNFSLPLKDFSNRSREQSLMLEAGSTVFTADSSQLLTLILIFYIL